MNYRQLGQSAIRISELSFGCMSLKSDNPNASKVIHQAIEHGVNFFDTADLYEFGLNEELLAAALEGHRKDVYVATKVGNEWTSSKDGWNWNPSKEYILRGAEGSLKRLRTDYIDLYLLHGGTINDPIDETIEAFEILRDQGKIRAYGISSIRPNVIKEYVKRSNIAAVMMQYSLLDRRPEEEILELLGKNDISVIVRGALAKGLLIDKPVKPYLELSLERVQQIQNTTSAIANNDKLKNSQVATGYVLNNKAIATAAVGFRTVEQVSDLLDGYYEHSLSPASYQSLATSPAQQFYTQHR